MCKKSITKHQRNIRQYKNNTLLIRQKDKSQNDGYNNKKHTMFSEN